MSNIMIIVPGQVYLHTEVNEYIVVTKVNRDTVFFKGPGLSGHNYIEVFIKRFQPVNPEDLTNDEYVVLSQLLTTPTALSSGWVNDEALQQVEDESEFIE